MVILDFILTFGQSCLTMQYKYFSYLIEISMVMSHQYEESGYQKKISRYYVDFCLEL